MPEQVHTPQFRTLAQQKPELSHRLKLLIERVERQRAVFLSLREELDDALWRPFDAPRLPVSDVPGAAKLARQWLALDEGQNDFESYRKAVEAKGIILRRLLAAVRLPRHELALPVLRLPMSDAVVNAAMAIKQVIGVVNDQYHPKGVDENDLFIIASAKVSGAELITNEARQFGAQAEARKCKIPAERDMAPVGVVSMNFLEFIQKSRQVF